MPLHGLGGATSCLWPAVTHQGHLARNPAGHHVFVVAVPALVLTAGGAGFGNSLSVFSPLGPLWCPELSPGSVTQRARVRAGPPPTPRRTLEPGTMPST